MAIAHSKITARGQTSVPAQVRRKLGIGPGSVIVWEDAGEQMVVRRAGRYTFEDIHKALFPDGPPKASAPKELKAGIRRAVRQRHARR